MRKMMIGIAAAALWACGDNKASNHVDGPRPTDADDGDVADAPDPTPDAQDLRTGDFDLTGGANSVTWDAATSTLFLTDNDTNSLLRFTDAGGVETVGALPSSTAGISLGDIVKRADGSFLVANFGFGTDGRLFHLSSTGTATAVTGMDATRRRIGLGQDSGGVLYEAYFVGGGGGMPNGGVATVAVTGTAAVETEIAGTSTSAGFKKLVGLVATPTAVFVSDQTTSTIYKIALPGFAVTTVATVPSADLLAILPNGDLLTGGTGVHRVTQAGVVTTIFTGFESVRGLAYDPALERLFFIEHSETVGMPDRLHIRPLDD